MNAIALRLVGDVGWGLKFRVFVGAALSTIDLMTDIFITYTFWKDGKEMFFRSSIAMICSSIVFMVGARVCIRFCRAPFQIFVRMLTVPLFGGCTMLYPSPSAALYNMDSKS